MKINPSSAKNMQSVLDQAKVEFVNNQRRNLYDAVHAKYISTTEVCQYANEIKKHLPDDFQANFYLQVVAGDIKKINQLIREIDVDANYDALAPVIHFLISSLQVEYLLELNNLVERAYKKRDLTLFSQFATQISEEAEKVSEGVYATSIPRDVFIAYSSKDMQQVSELCEELESQGVACFVAARNLRHGVGAVENYDAALKEAMDNCRCFVFVSSKNSRSLSCDAVTKEIPYIRSCDIANAPSHLRNNYKAIPAIYKKPRVEYRIGSEKNTDAASKITDAFFDGYEWTYTPEAVAFRVIQLLYGEAAIDPIPPAAIPIVEEVTPPPTPVTPPTPPTVKKPTSHTAPKKGKKKNRAPLIVALALVIAATACIAGYTLLGNKDLTDDPTRTDASTPDSSANNTIQSPIDSDSANTTNTSNPPVIYEPEGTVTVVEPPIEFNFGGSEITIISRAQTGEFSTELGMDGNSLNTAIYERDQDVANRLNVKINNVLNTSSDNSEILQIIARAGASGDADYDLVATPAYTTASESLNGTFLNLRSIPNLDLTKDYWNQNYSETMSYKDAQFSATGNLFLLDDFAFATAYNRELINQVYYSQDTISVMVQNGNWTLDAQISMVPTLYQNLNTATTDVSSDTAIYGFVSSPSINTDAYWISCDVSFIDATDFSYALNLEKLTGLTDRILPLFNADGTHVLPLKEYYAEQDDILSMFSKERAVMATLRLMNIRTISINDLGIAPMPKYDESQTSYPTPLDNQFSVVAIPSSVLTNRLEMVGAVLDALASCGKETVLSAYDSEWLKLAQNDDMLQMTDLIRENIVFDVGHVYVQSLDNFTTCLRTFIQTNTGSVSSYVAIREATLKNRIDTILQKLESLAE